MSRRPLPAILLLLGGFASLAYGMLYHKVAVFRDEEETVKISVPTPFGPGAGFSDPLPPDDEANPFESTAPLPPGDEANPFEGPASNRPPGAATDGSNPFEGPSAEIPPASDGAPWSDDEPLPLPLPGPSTQTITKTVSISHDAPEWTLVREITFGGVARLANGQLKQTYSGKPPALCPT